MKEYGYDYDFGTEDEGMFGEKKDDDGKRRRPMLENVISILKSLINILDIISDNFGRKK
jgi:hypothetical protein